MKKKIINEPVINIIPFPKKAVHLTKEEFESLYARLEILVKKNVKTLFYNKIINYVLFSVCIFMWIEFAIRCSGYFQ